MIDVQTPNLELLEEYCLNHDILSMAAFFQTGECTEDAMLFYWFLRARRSVRFKSDVELCVARARRRAEHAAIA